MIIQLFKSFSDLSKEPDQLFGRDLLLSLISLYWFTQTIHSSMGLYGENQEPLLNSGEKDKPIMEIANTLP